MRRKENLVTLKEMHEIYITLYEDTVDFKMYGKILREFNKWLREFTFPNNIFNMPYNLGKLYVKQSNPIYEFDDNGKIVRTNVSIDWVATKKLWNSNSILKEQNKRIYYENEHTDGRKMSIKWKKGLHGGISKHYFKPCRTYQRDLAKYIKNHPNTEYYGS